MADKPKEQQVVHALREYAERIGAKSIEDFAAKIGIPATTLRYWLNGQRKPRSRAHRAKLYELTGNPVFKGAFSKMEATVRVAPATDHRPAVSSKLSERGERLALLIRATLPDLEGVVTDSSPAERNHIRQKIGDNECNLFYRFVNAFRSEKNREVMIQEQLITSREQESVKGGRR